MCKTTMKVSLIIQILGKVFWGKENDEQALFVLLLLLPNCQPKLKIILSTKLEESLWFCLFVLVIIIISMYILSLYSNYTHICHLKSFPHTQKTKKIVSLISFRWLILCNILIAEKTLWMKLNYCHTGNTNWIYFKQRLHVYM